MKEDDESMQIHAAPGTCCPDMKLGLDGICTGCGHDHKLDAVIAELGLRRDWVEKCANIESKNARAMLTGARQEYHLAMARAYRRVRGHLKARIRYLLSLDKIRRERWLESIPDVRSSESNKAAFQKMKAKLMADDRFRGKYVAVVNQGVVDSDESEVRLVKRITRDYRGEAAYIGRVTEKEEILLIPGPF